ALPRADALALSARAPWLQPGAVAPASGRAHGGERAPRSASPGRAGPDRRAAARMGRNHLARLSSLVAGAGTDHGGGNVRAVLQPVARLRRACGRAGNRSGRLRALAPATSDRSPAAP